MQTKFVKNVSKNYLKKPRTGRIIKVSAKQHNSVMQTDLTARDDKKKRARERRLGEEIGHGERNQTVR